MDIGHSVRKGLACLLAVLAVACGGGDDEGAPAAAAPQRAEVLAPNAPPGGPILVVTSGTSPFSEYYAEILRNEGLSEFALADVSSLSASSLAGYDVVLLGKSPLAASQVTALANWVSGGGHLIAMAPDSQLAPLLGLTPTGATLAEGYLHIDTTTGPGVGLVNQTIQYHGSADRYTLNGASSVATLYSDANKATANPAVTTRAVGNGSASAFAYDLAASVIYTRQGNPAWRAQERDGAAPVGASDKFYGAAAGDARPDWVDRSKVAIPQADEQQRLLANLIVKGERANKPLPRFWYFPHGKKAVVIMTGEEPAGGSESGAAARFEQYKANSPAGCSLADWECVRATAYADTGAPLSAAQASAYTAEGFEVGLQVDPGCGNFDAASLQATYAGQLSAWRAKHPNLPAPSTQRHRCLAWSDWGTAAQTQLAHGMRLDSTYSFAPPAWAADAPALITGSAMPMRYSALDGSVIDVYQTPTHLTAAAGGNAASSVDALLDRALGAEGYYGAFTINAALGPEADAQALAVVASARARGVPVVSARQMLNWLDARNASSFRSLAWNGSTLGFTLNRGAGANGLQAMLPWRFGSQKLQSLTHGGVAHAFKVETIKGVDYAVFSGVGGAYVATYGGTAGTAPLVPSGRAVALAVYSGWTSTNVPTNPSINETLPVELGVKFRTSVSGAVTGVRFYKGAGNTGTHIGNLWTSGGQLLATATFTNETATGWQQVNFSSPVAIAANTVYVASYFAPNGGYAYDSAYFANSGVVNGTLELLQNGVSGGNGVYLYGASSAFPSNSYNATNYWVDVVFDDAAAPDTTPPTITFSSPAAGATNVAVTAAVSATFNEAIDVATVNASTFELRNAANALVSSSVAYNVSTRTATLTPSAALAPSSSYTVTVRGGATDPRIKDLAGNALASNAVWSFTTAAGTSGCPCSAFAANATPGTPSFPEALPVEVGVKFRTDISGYITGVRFYKGASNTGTHIGNLWTSAGQLLATAAFTGETATGWQQVNFSSPVAVTANTVYVASYFAPNGGYAVDVNYFAAAGVDNPPVHLLRDGVSGGNGVFRYGPSSGFPSQSFGASNYWVDVAFNTTLPPDGTPPSVTAVTPANGSTGVGVVSSVTAVFSEAIDGATVNGTTFELRNPSNAVVAATVSYDTLTRTATLTPNSALALATTYTATVRGGGADPRIKDLAGNALAANVVWFFTTEASSPCATPPNPVVAENCQTGNPPSEWQVAGAGDNSIQGFATQISVNRGTSVTFKVNTDATAYRFDIYRLGYYGGAGARKIATVFPSATLPQTQSNCLNDPATGLLDCGNWGVSGSWTVPSNAVSGIYVARLVRTDTNGASHILFIVRNDASTSNLLYKTSDTTWQAYNDYGGNSLYVGSPAGRAYKVSYNRPLVTRGNNFSRASFFGAEYPMVRWLEANGYDTSYIAGVDVERAPSLVLNHRALLSVGHDEYWSAGQRASVEAARDAGVHLAYFSGNQMFWKTRWENSIDGSATAYRTLVSYKETHTFPVAKIDPTPAWTGTWRDPRLSPPADGGRPENELSGSIFKGNCCSPAADSIEVPAEYGSLRLWRNTSVATLSAGQTATLASGTLGYEWDEDIDNGFRPPGLIRMSSTTVTDWPLLQDYGSSFGPGTATHNLVMHKRSSGAIVFAAGTIRWSWGLDATHDDDVATPGWSTTPDVRVQQATVNIFADMNAQPGTLRPGLVASSASNDAAAPSAAITAPTSGANLALNTPFTITGTAADTGGGVVAGIEVSVDGATWHPAAGRNAWSYTWTPTASGAATIRTRAIDDSGNIQGTPASANVTVGSSDTTPPTISARTPASGATGVTTTTNVTVTFNEAMDSATINNGTIELRDGANALVGAAVGWDAGTRTATLDPTPTLAASATYSVRVRGGGADPRVKDVAGNAMAADSTWSFTTAAAGDTTPPTITAQSPVANATGVSQTNNITVSFSEAMDATTIGDTTFELRDNANALVAAAVSYDAATRVATLNPTPTLAAQAVYAVRVRGGATDPRVKDAAGNALAADATWSFTTGGDGTPPTITAQSPTANATGVSRTANITVTFSEAMNASTITTGTFELRNPSNSLVAAAVSYNATTRVATLNPTPTLAALTVYTVTVRGGASGVQDSAGNPMAANAVWSFTTVVDTTPPTVSSVSPGSGATGVSRTANVLANFNEDMDASTINTSTFELRGPGGTLVTAVVTYSASNRRATLNPNATLAAATSYTATVLGGSTDPRVKDGAGNALATNRVWSFTTGP